LEYLAILGASLSIPLVPSFVPFHRHYSRFFQSLNILYTNSIRNININNIINNNNSIIMSEVESSKEYTLEEIAKNNTQESCWLIIGNVKTGAS
jgi:cytochrome b involved in lipid metabolism